MKKRIADLSPVEQEKVRAYNREQKAKSRAAQKAARHILDADEAAVAFAVDHPERVREIDAYVKDLVAKVTAELGRELGQPQKDADGNTTDWDNEEEFVINRVATLSLSLKEGWVQTVQEGELIGGSYFGDCSGSMVETANRCGLKMSPLFNNIYMETVAILDRRYGCQQTQDAAIVKAELAGEYVLPPLPQPKAKLNPEAPSVPINNAVLLEQGRLKLLNQLRCQSLPPDAR